MMFVAQELQRPYWGSVSRRLEIVLLLMIVLVLKSDKSPTKFIAQLGIVGSVTWKNSLDQSGWSSGTTLLDDVGRRLLDLGDNPRDITWVLR